jgi:hypothetical protein
VEEGQAVGEGQADQVCSELKGCTKGNTRCYLLIS